MVHQIVTGIVSGSWSSRHSERRRRATRPRELQAERELPTDTQKKKNRLDGFDCRRKPNGFPGSCVSVPHPGESESSFTGGGGISAQTAAAGSERRGCVQRLSSPEKMPGLQQPGGPPVPFRFSPHPHRASSLVLI
ncbi:hypothetical protein FQA47_003719 [Oryzias melastigma]|uniref:Uncharacterized protein n=1 Tax=Oryzias melastigma TaxID=30732 RepID=A0A834C4H7_ORYME|nr:hypothetical protein FQA47_003719 [Oryzias melastigma]